MKGGNTALITGATSGIGKAFAEHYAGEKYDLILTGRRSKEIALVAEEITRRFQVRVKVIVAEFSRESDLARVVDAAREEKDIGVLVNNAGFGLREGFLEADLADDLAMVQVHAIAPLRLAHAVLPRMIERREGTIVNVASMAAFTPSPGGGMYSATKSFLHVWSESLFMEAGARGVKVLSLCPGFTHTDFHYKLGIEGKVKSRGVVRWMEPEKVVAAARRALKRGKAICVPGFLNRVLLRLARWVPRGLYYRIGRNMSLGLLEKGARAGGRQ